MDEAKATTEADPLDGVRAMLLAFVPEAGAPVQFHDVEGFTHQAPSECSARTLTRLMEAMDRRKESLAWVTEMYREKGVGQTVMTAALNPATLDMIEEAFEILHRRALDAAISTQPGPEKYTQARDLFSTAQMLRAVLPFYAAPMLEILTLIQPALAAVVRSR